VNDVTNNKNCVILLS